MKLSRQSVNSTASNSHQNKNIYSHNRSQPINKGVSSTIISKKKIKNYVVSYCPKQLLGKSLYGEIRLGHNQQKSKVMACRINSQPLSHYVRENLKLQKKMGRIKDCVCQIYDTIDTKTSTYTIIEYFPKTFKTQLDGFQKMTKYLDQLLQKFMLTYAKLYYLKINHGNISLDNIGVTFDGKVKLMDFRPLSLSFEEGAAKDYRDFKNMMCTIMLREKVFPVKLQCLDLKDGNWQQLFSSWHTVHPYQYIYLTKKNHLQNSIVLLNKLQNSVLDSQSTDPSHLQIAFRLLLLQKLYKLCQISKRKAQPEITKLKSILSPILHDNMIDNLSFYNSILWGILSDPDHYELTHTHRLTLISCILGTLNHEYLYSEILKQLDEQAMSMNNKNKMNHKPNRIYKDYELEQIRNNQMHEILGQNLFFHYNQVLKNNLLSLASFEHNPSHRQFLEQSSSFSQQISCSKILTDLKKSKKEQTTNLLQHSLRENPSNYNPFTENIRIKNRNTNKLTNSVNFGHYIKNISGNSSKVTNSSSIINN